MDPQDAPAYFGKARALEMTGDKEKAVEAYKAFIRCAPDTDSSGIDYAKEKIVELGT